MSGTVRAVVHVTQRAAGGSVEQRLLYRHFGHKEVLASEELPCRKCCPECAVPLRRRDKESQSEFQLRTYCGRRCARAAVSRVPMVRRKVTNGPHWVD